METEVEKIDFRQTLQLQIHTEAEIRWNFSLMILMLDIQRRFQLYATADGSKLRIKKRLMCLWTKPTVGFT